MFDALDPVALTVDLTLSGAEGPAHGLARGSVGTVVRVYAHNAFEVEFVDNDGRTYALATLSADQLLRLHFAAPAAAA